MINTIHGVKGGEADNVVIKLDFTKSVRENFENNPDSELRCLYVACTRAKKNLHIVFSNSKNGYDSYIHF
jgi:superfamily I DNA/RNA helicase